MAPRINKPPALLDEPARHADAKRTDVAPLYGGPEPRPTARRSKRAARKGTARLRWSALAEPIELDAEQDIGQPPQGERCPGGGAIIEQQGPPGLAPSQCVGPEAALE